MRSFLRALTPDRVGQSAALLAASLLSGCGYSTGVRPPLGYETVGVTVFDNLGPEPSLERDLYLVLSQQANRMLDAELLSPARSDLLIRGQIADYSRLSGVLSVDGELQQSGARITLTAWLEDGASGARLGEAILFDQAVRYVIRAGEGERGARSDALAQITQEMLLDLFTQVDYSRSDAEGPPEEEQVAPAALEAGTADPEEQE